MKRFKIQGSETLKSYMDILNEDNNGFQVKITRKFDDWTEEKIDFLPKELFDSCVRTRYLVAV